MAFTLAIIGGGGISRAHIGASKASGGKLAVAAVVDPVEASRTAAGDAAAAKGFASIDELLASPTARTIQGVVVCTPPSVRLEIVEKSLKAGWHVLAEKPLAQNVADARKLTDLAGEYAKLVTAVGYCHRFTPAIIEMKKRIASGEIGAVSRFENTFACYLEQRMKTHWMSDAKVSGGGSLIDTGCHSLDLFQYLLGRAKVTGAVLHHAWAGRAESSATVLVRSEKDGVAGTIQSGWCEPARFIVGVVGTKCTLFYDYERATELFVRPNDGPEQKVAVETHDVRFQRQLEAFAEAATGGKPAIRPATFADGLAVAENVEQAYAAARK